MKRILAHAFFLVVFFCAICFVAAAEEPPSEAARFAREAEFSFNHKNYDESLKQWEAAAALDPKNAVYRRELAIVQSVIAIEFLFPGQSNTSGYLESSRKPNSGQWRRALNLAARSNELSEKLSEQHDYETVQLRLATFRKSAQRLAEREAPEHLDEIRRLNRRILNYWIEKYYRPLVKSVNSRRTLSELFVGLMSYSILTNQSPSDLAAAWHEIVGDLLPLSQKYPHDFFLEYFVQYQRFAVDYRLRDFGESDEEKRKTTATIDRTLALFEQDERLNYREFAWMTRHRTYTSGPGHTPDPEACREYFEQLKKRLEAIPANDPSGVAEMFYDELTAATPHRLKAPPFFNRFAEIIELALSRGETAPAPCGSLMLYLSGSKRDGKTPEKQHYYEELIRQQILLAESLNKRKLADDLRASGERYELDLFRTKTIKPWNEEIVLLSDPVKELPYQCPVLHGDELVLFMFEDGKIRADRLDLKTRKIRRGRSLAFNDTKKVIEHNQYGPIRNNCSFVDDHNAYFGSENQGIFVFPHNNEKPWSLSTKDELPSDKVLSMGAIGNRLYVMLGGGGAWLLAVDLDTKKWELLSSSRGKTGAAPFFDMPMPAAIPFFVADKKRNRLLFVARSNDEERFGLWSIDGKSYEFVFLRKLPGWSDYGSGKFVPGEDRLLIRGMTTTWLLDLECIENEDALQLWGNFGGRVQDYDMKRDFVPIFDKHYLVFGAAHAGFLWGQFSHDRPFWGRIPLDGKGGFEPLEIPARVRTRMEGRAVDWAPRDLCLPTPDGRGLLVGDDYYIILLRFE